MVKELNKEDLIKSAYSDLKKHGNNGEYEKALKSVNKILSVAPTDETALQCKVVCLIQISKFHEAYQYIEKNQLNSLYFEKAYCEYRLNLVDQSLATIDSSNINPIPENLRELRAQVLYRKEDYGECFQLYKEIIRNSNDDYEDERKTNMNAIAANLSDSKSKPIPAISEDTYEMCFNSACALVNLQQFSLAEQKLLTGMELCRVALEEDGLTEEEIEEELASFRVQQAFCYQVQGKIKEAAALYGEALKNKSKDVALTAVASNNLVAINKDQNMFDSKKKIRLAMSENCEHKLNRHQKKFIALNNCLLALYTNAQCDQVCRKLTEAYPDLEYEATLIKSSAFAREKKYKQAIEVLQVYATTQPKHRFAVDFAIIQILLLSGNRKGAADKMIALGESKYKPGVISALVTLLLGIDEKSAASEVLKEAVDWYKNSSTVSKSGLTDMWRKAADFHLRGGEPQTAASSLEELLKSDTKNMNISAQLVIAYAMFDSRKAINSSKNLPALETLTTAAEIDTLEASNWIMSAKAVKKATTKADQSPSTPGTDLEKKKKTRHRKRKGKLPKNYNKDAQPDPERWLPKYERTGYRRKRDRRTKEVIKGSQGMSSGAADQYDMSKTQNLSKASPLQSSIPEPPLRQHPRKVAQKKKKGRH